MKVLLRMRAPSAIGLIFAFLLTVVLPSHRGGAQGTPTETLTFAPVGDTYVESSSPGTNYDTAKDLKADDSPVRLAYLRFAVTGVNGRPVQSARLQLEVTGPSVSGGRIHTVNNVTWQATTMTFANRPAVNAAVVGTLGPVTTGSIVEFNLDTVITADGTYSFAIDSTSSDGVSYASMAATSAQPPRLVLEVESGPHPLVTIVQPPDTSTFFVGDSVSLQATVTDDLDVNLENLVQWTSDVDGGLGVGASVSSTLSEGTHVVTATVTDSDELTGSDQVAITIVQPPAGNTAPLVSITAPLDNRTFTSTEMIAFTATATDLEDGALTSTLSWTSDQEGLIGLGGNFTTTLSEGSHEITATVNDAGGLTGTAAVSVNVIAPDIVTLEPVADTYVDSVRPTTNYGSDTTLRVDADSERTTYLRFAVAGVGNRTVSRAILRLEVDGESGAGSDAGGTVHTISNGAWLENVMTYNTRPVVDGPAWAMADAVAPGDVVEFDVTAAVTEDGVYNFAVVGDSPDGVKYLSREGGTPSLTLELSGNAPMVTISAPTGGAVIFTAALPLQLAATATDTEDGDVTAAISWTSSLEGALGTGGTVAAGGLRVGTHVITAAVTDADGLMGQAQVSIAVRAPNVAPVVNVTAPAAGASIPAGTMVGLAATATDDFDGNLSGALSWSSSASGALGTGSPLAVTLAEGAHTLTASVTDSDGATGSAQVAVTITPTAPMVSIVAPAAGAMVFAGNVVTFTGTASDATDGDVSAALVWTSSIGGQIGTGATFTTTALAQGTHTVTAAVTDGGGLTGQAVVTIEVRPPNTLPLVVIDTPADQATLLNGSPLLLSGSASDAEDGDLGAQMAWTSDLDGALGTGAVVSVASLSKGTHVLTAGVTDADGGTAADSVTVTVGDPTIVVLASADTYVDSSTPGTAFGTETSFRVDASPIRQVYMRFPVTGVPPFAVGRAILRLTVGSASGNKSDFGGTVRSMTSGSWSEATTYNTRPVIDGPVLATVGAVEVNQVVDVDVTGAVVANGTYNFAMTTTVADAAGYVSREGAAAARPRLILTLVQNAPPSVTITAPSAGSAVLPDALLTLRATAADAEDGDLSAQVEWRSDIEGVLGTGASIGVALEPGMHTITAQVSDSSGLSDTDQMTINVGSPPTVTIASPLDGAIVFTNEPALSFSGSALDGEDGSLTAQITWTSSRDGVLGTGASVTPSLTVGAHTITAAVTDSDNLTGEAQISVRVRTPNVAPVVTITAPPAGTAVPVGTPLALTATATDDFDGNISATIDWTSNLDGQLGSGAMLAVPLSQGMHTVTASVQDSDGLAGGAQISIEITPTPPAVTIVVPANGTTVFAGNPVTFTGTASDLTDGNLTGGLVWTSDMDGPIGAGASFTTTALSEGTHGVTAAATNGSGLTGQASIIVVVRPPNELPVVSIDAPTDGATLLGGTPVTLIGTATDAEDGVLSGQMAWGSNVDGPLGAGATLTVAALSQGAHTLTATVTDLDGATVSASVAVTVGQSTLTFVAVADTEVDNSAPGVPLGAESVFRMDASPVRQAYVRFVVTGVPPFAVEQATLRLTVGPNSGNASDTGGRVHSMSNTGWSEATTTFNTRPAIDGPLLATKGAVATGAVVDFDVTPAVRANGIHSFGLMTDDSDAAGYRSREAGTGVPLLILKLKPNTAPTVTVTAPASEVTLLPGTPITVAATANDAEDGVLDGQIQWSSDVQGALGTGPSITVTLDPGPHTITAAVTDSSGGTAQDSVVVNMSGAPDVTITAPADGTVIFTNELPLTLSGTALDDEDGPLTAQLQWTSNNDGPIGTGGTISTPALSVGLHTITAAVTDSDSVTGKAQIAVRVRLPNVGPNVTITAPSTGASTPAGSAMGLAATASDDFDGNISGLVQWASDRDGVLGTGAALAATLTEGAHVLSATVTDSDGVVDTDQVSVNITPTPPVVTVVAPADGTTIFNTNLLTFTGAASDATDGDLSGALVWTSDLDGPIGTGATFTDTTLSVGTHTVVAAATDAGGLVGQAAVVIVVRPPNDLPVLTIDTPADGAAVLTGASVLLVATALDTEDGDLGAQVSWTSDIQGALGTGGTISVPNLSPTTHVLTASVTDGDGATVTASVTVTVGQATLTFPAVADTYVDDSTATQALGSQTTFRVDTSPVREGYLRFNVTGVPPFAVERAVLRLTVGPDSGNSSDVGGTVYSMSSNTWSEATTTFNTKPTIDGPALATAGAVSTNDVVDFDVTAAILADGVYNFGVKTTVSDAAGYNTREASSGRPQLILTLALNTPPVVSVTAPAPGTIVLPETPLVLSGTATDAEEGDLAAQIEWRSDVDGVLGSGATLSPTGLSDGPHTITAAVTDSSDATTEETVDIVIEDVPVVAITAPAAGSSHFVTEAVTLAATANDLQDGDLSAQILWESSLDGSLGVGASITTSSLSLGTHAIRAHVSDSRDLLGEATISLTVEINDPPTVAITAPPAGTNYVEGTMATFTGAAIDPEQGDLSAAIAWTSSRDGALGTGPVLMTPSLSVGAHVITATIEDNRSLGDSATVNVTVEVNDPPVISISAPASGAIVHMSEAVGFAGTATDPEDGNLTASLTWTSDRDGPIGVGAGFVTSTLSIGTHVITASATDTLGLASSGQITIEVINDAPDITVLSPANGASTFIQNPITFTATALDTEDGDLAAGLSWTSSLDGALGTGGGFTLTTLSVGTHLITTQVTDSGNAPGTASIILVVNDIPAGRHAPVVTIVQPVALSVFEFGDPVTFMATATDQDDGDRSDFVTWTSDVDGVFGSGASVAVSTLTIATHQITATVSDSDGIIRFDQIQIEIEEPNEPPVVTISAPLDGDEVNEQDPVIFTATATDLEDGDLTAQLLWTSDVDGVIGTGGIFTTSTLSPGTHVLDATVLDSRDDTGAAQIIITVHPIPVVTIRVPEPGVGYLDATPVDFFADAVDAVEGDVSASLTWTSDLDGPIGTGRSFTTDALTLGPHTITAVATNSRGGTGAAQVGLVVSVDTMILDPVADAYVDAAAPNTPFGLATDLLIDASPERAAYMRFNVNGIGPFPIDSADLLLTVRTDGAGSYGGNLHRVTNNTWTEAGVTFATRPTVGPLIGTAPQAVDASDVVGFDLTSVIVGDGMYSLVLLSTSADGVRYNSRQAAANHPQLTVVLGQRDTPQIPELTITSPASGAVIFDDAPALLTATASDAEDGDLGSAIAWRSDLDGPLGTGGSLSAVLSRGTHLITASVEDSFGLVATQTVTLTIVDRPPPVSINAPAAGAFFPRTLPVTLSATVVDDLDGDLSGSIQWSSQRDGLLGTGASVTTATLSSGDHVIEAAATNSLGTTGTDAVTIYIDQAPPVVTISSPPSGTTVAQGTPLTLMGTAMDLENGDLSGTMTWMSDLEGPLGTGRSVPAVLDVVGTHHITASATDTHGFTTTAEIFVTITVAPPVVMINAPLDGAAVAGPIGFSGTALDHPDGDLTASIRWTSNRSGLLGTGATVPPVTLSVGQHVITAQVTDSDGLTGSTSITVVSGVVPPTVAISQPVSSNATVSEVTVSHEDTVTFVGTASDAFGVGLNGSITWASDLDGPLGTGSALSISTLVRGRHVVTATATDARGLSATARIAVNVTAMASNNPPLVSITGPSSGTTVQIGTPVTMSAMATDDLEGDLSGSVSWLSDLDGLVGTGASINATLRTVGDHTITAAVADSIGLVGTATVTVSVVAPFASFAVQADVHSDQSQSTTNFGALDELRLDQNPARAIYLRFTTTGIGAQGVGSAFVRMQTTSQSSAGSDDGGDIHLISNNTWGELTLTHANAPVISTPALDSVGAVVPSQTVDFDVTPAITGDGTFNFAINPMTVDLTIYRSREASVGAPELVVFFEPPASQAPVVEITQPANFVTLPAGVPSTFSGIASDIQDGPLSVAIIWRSNVDGILGIGPSITRTLSAGPHVITAQVNDTGGFVGTDLIFVQVGDSPAVTILAPAPGTSIPLGQSVVLAGSAFDPQDDDLTDSLAWASSIDGQLGTGPSIMVTLSPGTHVLTASVMDSDGHTGTAQSTVSVSIGNVGFQGHDFGGADTDNNRLTGAKPESKVWNTDDGIWWATMYRPSTGRYSIHRMNFATHTWVDTGVEIDERITSRQDVLFQDNKLYVVSRMSLPPGQNRFVRFTYHPAAQLFVRDPGFPVDIDGGGTEAMTIARDSTGMLWAAFTLDDLVWVMHTIGGDDSNWSDPFLVPIADENPNALGIYFDDISAVIALHGKIGIFWSNQNTKVDYFAVHVDGTPTTGPAFWTLEVAASGNSAADDHFNLKLASDGRLYVVLKTSRTAIGSTLNALTVRATNGTWSPLHHINSAENKTTRPVLLLDEVRRKIRVFYSPFENGIYTKVSNMDNISFPSPNGIGTPFISHSGESFLNNPTTTKSNIDPSTGFVVLAASKNEYWHNAIDPEPVPSVMITVPSDGLKVATGTSVSFAGTAFSLADGDVTSELSWTSTLDGAIGVGASFATSTLSEGEHVVMARVTDNDLLTGSASVTVTVETDAPPVVTIAQPMTGQGFFGTDTVTFTGTVLDSVDGDLTAGLQWTSTLDGPLGTGGSFTTTGLSLGTHTITAAVTDSGSLTGTASVTVEIQVSAPPTLTISLPADGFSAAFGQAVPFAGAAFDAFDGDLTSAISWISDRDGAIGTGGSFSRPTLSLGTHTITATVIDSHGRSDSATVTVFIGAPVLVVSSPGDGSTFVEGTPVTFAGTAADPQDGDVTSSITWSSSLDGTLGSGGSLAVDTLSPGHHTITVQVMDSNGATDTETLAITILGYPIVTITDPADGAALDGGTALTLAATALDPEDGNVAGLLVWSSDRDGPLGAGASLTTNALVSFGSHTITASVTDTDVLTGSDTVTIIVNDPPSVTIQLPADGSTFDTTDLVDVNATATDAEDGDLSAQIVWTSDRDGALGTGSSVSGLSLAAGVHTITASVTDSAGSTRADTIMLTMNIPPTVTIGTPIDGATVQVGDPVNLSATADDSEDGDLSVAIIWRSDADGPLGIGASVTAASLTAGVHTITASVSDTAGSTRTDTITVTVNEGPTVTITTPADGVTINETDSVTLGATASDTEDGDLSPQVTWTSDVDGGLGSGASVVGVSLSAGVHGITASVTDADAGTGSDTITVTVNALPIVTISAPVNGTTVETVGLVTLTGAATDAEDGSLTAQIAWSSDLAGPLGGGGSVSGVSLAAGVHTITASVTDANGAIGDDTVVLTVNTPPSISITAPANGVTVETVNPLTLTATATDTEDGNLAAVISWSSDQSGPLGTGGSVTGVFLSSGAHTITASVTDTGGSTRTTAVTVTMNTPPSVTMTAPLDGAAFDTSDAITLSGTASDAESGNLSAAIAWSSSIDGSLGTGGTVTGVNLGAGAHTITASVTDGGGSTRTDTALVTVNAVPMLTIGAPTNGANFQATDLVNLSASATDAEDGSLTPSIAWTSNVDGTLGTGGSVTGLSLSAGVHTITASVADSAGAGVSKMITVTINAPPVVTITAPADGVTLQATDLVALSGTANDPEDGDLTASIAWTSDQDGALGTGGSVTGLSLSVGVHTITAAATDSDAGAGSAQITVTINAPPVVTITAPADGATFASTDSIDLGGTANDPEDGDLATSIAWTSDQDGPLGTGASVTGVTLSAGVHTLTAAVTDSDAAPGTAQITVTITGP